MEQNKAKKRKRDDVNKGHSKRRQIVIRPEVLVYSEDDATLPLLSSGVSSGNETVGDLTMLEMEEPGEIVSDANSMTDISDSDDSQDQNLPKETDPLRNDMPIVGSRWQPEEVDALMTALNVNRDAVKFHFCGPGGGREVKRQGWRDVAGYVNDVANTHRTVRQCRDKSADYTQRCKAKFNKLRYVIATTGKGKIKKGLQMKATESKALDYLREEAVKGIPGIEPMELPESRLSRPRGKNKKLLWKPDREGKPVYTEVQMKREGVPHNYGDKNKRRLSRLDKIKRQKEHAKAMRKERRQEKKESRKRKLEKVRERAEEKEMESAFKIKRKKEKEERKKRKEDKKLRKEKRKLKKKQNELQTRAKELRKKEKKRDKKK